MKVAIVTLFPEMFAAITDYGVTGRAVKQGLLDVAFFNPRSYTSDRHQTVDHRPYGGGPGMVMTIEPLRAAITEARGWAGPGCDGAGGDSESRGTEGSSCKVVYLSPQGQVLNQTAVQQFASAESGSNLVLLCGRYEGVDERLIELEVDEEWSIGDYVLSGGELPAMVMLDGIIRQLPGALGHEDSAQQDSFAEGAEGLLDCPHYTRPEQFENLSVPEVLLSGNHEKIRQWRLQQSLLRTQQRRPDLLGSGLLGSGLLDSGLLDSGLLDSGLLKPGLVKQELAKLEPLGKELLDQLQLSDEQQKILDRVVKESADEGSLG